jgi:hypothetical protein
MTLDFHSDYTTKDGAERLAAHIRAYWRSRGHDVRTYAVRTFTGHGERHDVRSDMIGGQP